MNPCSMHRLSIAAAIAWLAAPLGAQGAPSPLSGWSALLGCWSTSSAGSVGPTVCIVPTDSAQRVEFLTIAADSITARTMIDASGAARPIHRGPCAGFEAARWSADAQRLYTRAEYRCRRGPVQQSDAIISLTQADAFSHIERSITSDTAPTRVVNFLARSDSGAIPAEVRQRLARVAPPTRSQVPPGEVVPVDDSAIVDALMHLDARVVDAWLVDRGQRATLPIEAVAALRLAAVERVQSIWPRHARFVVDRLGMASVRTASRALPVSQGDDIGLRFEPLNSRTNYHAFGGTSLSNAAAVSFGKP